MAVIPSPLMRFVVAHFPSVNCRPYFGAATILICDVLSLVAACVIGVGLWHHFGGAYEFSTYWRLSPAVIIFVLVFRAINLYPGIMINGVVELQDISKGVTLGFLIILSITFILRQGTVYSRGAFILTWAAALFLVPLFRTCWRYLACSFSWWGYPVVLLDAGDPTERIARMLVEHPESGLKPVAIITWAN